MNECPACLLTRLPHRCTTAVAFLAGMAFVLRFKNEAITSVLCVRHKEELRLRIVQSDEAIAEDDRRQDGREKN